MTYLDYSRVPYLREVNGETCGNYIKIDDGSWEHVAEPRTTKSELRCGSLFCESFTQLYPNSGEVHLMLGMPPTKDKAQGTFKVQLGSY